MHRRRAVVRPERAAVALLAVVIVSASASTARADTFSGVIQPSYSRVDGEFTDPVGNTTRSTSQDFQQLYRLSLDKELFPRLSFIGTGSFQKTNSWFTSGGRTLESDATSTGISTRLNYTNPVLTSGLGYDRRQDGSSLSPIRTISDTYSFSLGWHPPDLLPIDLTLGRSNLYDSGRREQDTTVDTAHLGTRYAYQKLDLRYSLGYANPVDHRSGTDSTSIDETVNASYADNFFDRRTAVYVSGTVSDRRTRITTAGAGGLITTQKLPFAGLSAIEVFPALPTQVALDPNPAVIDGSTASSAGIDIGFSPSLANDTNLRDVGAQFADVITEVNTIYVWVDRELPAPIVSAFAWTVYQSDDNQRWTEVPIVAPVVFGTFQNRFEITIPTTAARYLKVVTKPLQPTVTTDQKFSNVFITELQFFTVLPASSVRRFQASQLGTLNATQTTRILKRPGLTYDTSLLLTRGSDTPTTWALVNGLSLNERLNRKLTLTSRVARQDTDLGLGHEGAFQWGATLLARWLPTLSQAASYSGQYTQTRVGNALGHSVGLLTRADLYQGISLLSNLTASRGTGTRGEVGQTALASVGMSFTPNQYVGLSTNWIYTEASTSATAMLPGRTVNSERVDASITYTPYEALFFSGSLTRVILGARPTTLASVSGTFSPLRGELQLSLAYSRSLDTEARSVSQFISPSLRWSIRRGVFLDAGYTLVDSTAPAGDQKTRALTANLLLLI